MKPDPRKKFLDKISFFGQQRSKEKIEKLKNSILNARLLDYSDYTDTVLRVYKDLFESGEVDSRPIKEDDGMIVWRNRNEKISRLGGLPAAVSPDNGFVAYVENSGYHREDGPAEIFNFGYKRRPEIKWYKNGSAIAFMYVNEDGEISLAPHIADYAKTVRSNFPKAGDKIWLWDYVDDLGNLSKDKIEAIISVSEDYDKIN